MNKKLVSLILTMLMILSMGVCVHAELGDVVEDISYISDVDWDEPNDDDIYDITATVIGDSKDLDNAVANLVLTDCTFKLADSGSISDIIAGFGTGEVIRTVDGRTVCRYEVTFHNMEVPKGDNVITFTVIRSDGARVVLKKSFNIRGSNNGGGIDVGDGDGDGDGDDDEDEDKPIAALKPHLIVDGYSYGQAVAGQDVPLTFTLKNTSKSKIMRNIVLNVKPAGDLRIKSSSDTIYIDSVDPGETITKTVLFALGAAAKEEVQVVGLTSTFEYFDIEGENAAQGGDTVSISIPTDTLERVKIQKVELPEMLYPNMEEEIAYSIINSGFSTLYNAEIKIVDEAGTEYAAVYVGSIEPSKAVTEPYLPIILPEAGEKNLKFVLTYENDKLQTQEVTKDFKATVMEMPMEKPPIFEEPMPGESLPGEEGKAPWLMWAFIGGGAIVVIIVLVVVIKVVRKKRREREDEDI